ncbi:50S ribosomal protein L17 [Patescibacteria group bacterium]
MRHRVTKKILGRDKEHRKALMSNLSSQLIEHGKINTTLSKAKVLRPFVEKLITKAKKPHKGGDKLVKFNTVKDLRKYLRNEETIKKLIEEVAPKYLDRAGGYTRIVKTGERDGDKAPTARIELVKGKETKKEEVKKASPKKKVEKNEK